MIKNLKKPISKELKDAQTRADKIILQESVVINPLRISSPIAGGQPGYVLYTGSDGSLSQSSSFYWDYTNNRLGIRTTSPNSALQIGSTNTTDGTGRIRLGSYERAVNPTHYGEVLRIDWLSNQAKPAIAFRDGTTTPSAPVSKAWLMAHDYLTYTSSTYTKSFTDGNVTTGTGLTQSRITITGHGMTSADRVKFWNSGGALPTGLTYLQNYYVKVLDANTIEIYRGSGLAAADQVFIIAAAGGGTHYLEYMTQSDAYATGNNPHKHVGIEVSDATAALQTRLEILFDMTSSYIRTSTADFVVSGGYKLWVVGASGGNREIRFGTEETDVASRWSVRADNTAETSVLNSITNVGSDFRIVRFTDAGVASDAPFFIKRSSGNVGIGGQTAPANALHVLGSIQASSSTAPNFFLYRDLFTQNAEYIVGSQASGLDQWGMGLRSDSTQNWYLRDKANGVNVLSAVRVDATSTVTGTVPMLNIKRGSYRDITADSDAATITFNMGASDIHTVTLGGNRTLAVSNVQPGQVFMLRLLQDGTGSRTVTWFSTIKWAGGSAPTLTTTASKADLIGFLCTSSGNYDGYIIGQNI